jgi:hypothetical protein
MTAAVAAEIFFETRRTADRSARLAWSCGGGDGWKRVK